MARPTRKMMIVAAVVVAVAAVGGGATYLATSPTALSGFSQASPAESGGGKADKPGRSERAKARRAERGGADGILGRIEHGEFTTASAGVMQVQRGAITAIDAGSVTVRSTDGFTASYTITPTTTMGRAAMGRRAGAQAPAADPAPGAAAAPGGSPVAALKTGDTVQVTATKTDTGSTATRIAPTRA